MPTIATVTCHAYSGVVCFYCWCEGWRCGGDEEDCDGGGEGDDGGGGEIGNCWLGGGGLKTMLVLRFILNWYIRCTLFFPF